MSDECIICHSRPPPGRLDGRICAPCHDKYPPNLLRACVSPGSYLLRTVDPFSESGTPEAFSTAMIRGDWVTIRALDSANVDVRLDKIVWVIDAKEIQHELEEEPVRTGQHLANCASAVDAMLPAPDPWVVVLDENRKPMFERCRYCKVEREISQQPIKDAVMAKVAPKPKGNIR